MFCDKHKRSYPASEECAAEPKTESFSFFYDGGAEGGLSVIAIEAESENVAWEIWDAEHNEDGEFSVRLVILNLADGSVLFQE